MKLKLSAIAMLAMIVPTQARTATLTDAEATFLDVQLGARLLGSADAAMAMIDAFNAAIIAHDGKVYDPSKFRPEVSEAASKTLNRVRADLIKNPKAACADYGNTSVSRGLLRRY